MKERIFRSHNMPVPSYKSVCWCGRRVAAGKSGQATVEFAFIGTVFLLLLLVPVELGQVLFAYNCVAQAAREGSRYAAVHGYDSNQPASANNITAVVQGQTVGLDPNKLKITASWSPNNKAGSVVQVQVQYQYPLSLPFMSQQTLTLTSTSTMVMS